MKNKLNIAVISCSGMAKKHMKGVIAKEDACLYAVCDIEEKRLYECQNEFSVPVATTDWRELVNDPNPDAAVLVTPDKLHTEMTVAFLRAGKDVLCEKPMALTVADCEEMMRAEKESGRRLMIGQVARCTPAFIMAKDLIDSGRIGELFFVESEYAHNYARVRGQDDWRVDPDRHAVIGGGCHAIDLLRWITDSNPEEVYAYANHKSLTDWPVDDSTIAIYRFPNAVNGKVFVSIGCYRNYTMRSVFYGTRGTIICDNTSPTIILFENDPNNKELKYTTPTELPVEINNHNITAEIDVFVDALLSGAEMPVTSMEGASTVAVACATVEAAAKGHPIKIRYPQI